MNDIWTQLLREYLVLNESEVFPALCDALKDGYDITTDGVNYVFCVPKESSVIPVLLCAHVDTVRNTHCDEPVVLAELNGTIFNENGILGGDDRAGVAGCIAISRMYSTKPYLLFTNGEERGSTGMHEFLSTRLIEPHLPSIYTVVSLDRAGHNEYVNYSIPIPEDLECRLLTLGYTQKNGSYSDGMQISSAYSIAYANLSIGYNDQHTANEFVLIESYVSAIRRAAAFIISIDKKYTVDKPVYTPYKYYAHKPTTVVTTTTTKSGPPWPEKEKELVSTNPVCFCCGRTDRDAAYIPNIGTFLCHTCSKQITTLFGSVSLPTMEVYKEGLEEQRKKTREANSNLNPSRKDKGLPSCPICKDNKHVAWNKTTIGFTCTLCQEVKPDGYDGNFWVRGVNKHYIKDGKELVTDYHATRLLNTLPKGGMYLKQCAVCHKYSMNCKLVLVGKDRDKPLDVCPSCIREAETMLLSDKMPPYVDPQP